MSWIHTKVSFFSVYQFLRQIIITTISKIWSCNSIEMVEALHEFNNPKSNQKFRFCENLILPIILTMYCPYIIGQVGSGLGILVDCPMYRQLSFRSEAFE
jgi:hypothetical protein